MRYIIKWRFILKVAVGLLIAAVAIHFTHRWQVRRQAGDFLYRADLAKEEAEKKEKEEDIEGARAERDREETFLRHYVLARPSDIDVRERLVRLLLKNARTAKQYVNAYYSLEDVLRRDENRDDLRRFVIKYALDLGFSVEAQRHIEFLRDKRGLAEDGELLWLLGRCFFAQGKYQEAMDKFELSITARRDWIDSYKGLALALREMEKSKVADATILDLVKKNRGRYLAYVLAAEYMRSFGVERLKEDPEYGPPESYESISAGYVIQEALKLEPNDLKVLMSAAREARSRSRKLAMDPRTRDEAEKVTQEARDYLARAVQHHPESADPYVEKAALEAQTKGVEEAMKVVRAGLEKLPSSLKPVLKAELMKYQFQAGDSSGAEKTLAELDSRGLPEDIYRYHSAHVKMLKGEWQTAAAQLERAISEMQLQNKDKPGLIREANLLLAQCYEQLGKPQRRLEACTRALPPDPLDPLWARAMQGIAESEAALGRADDALKTYRKMTSWYPSMWVPVARLELVQALRAPDGKDKWTKVEEALKYAERVAEDPKTSYLMPDKVGLVILRADVEHQKGHPELARKKLEELRNEWPKDVAVRLALAMQDSREQRYKEALDTIEAAQKELGDSLEVRLAKARVWAAMKDPELAAKLTSLAANTEKFTIAQKRQLLQGLADIASFGGADQVAARFWGDLASARPFDLSIHLVRFDRAVRAGNRKEMDEILAKIAEIDGSNGPTTRLARAVILLQEYQATNDRSKSIECLRILEGLEKEQGASTPARVFLGQAIIHDRNGETRLALPKYRQAVNRGESNPIAIRRLVEILRASGIQGEQEEAAALLAKLQNAPNLGPDFQRLAAEVSLRVDDPAKALEYANRAVREDSKDYKDQLWLGMFYWQTNQPADRVKARFQKATELAPEAIETWLTLMQYYVATKKAPQAARVFEQAREKVSKPDRAFFQAVGYLQLGETSKAIEAFGQARKEKPDDPRILMAEADLFLQLGRLADARSGFKRAISLPSASADEKARARHGLALATAADPNYTLSKGAIDLITPSSTANETPAQRRERAIVMGLLRDRQSKLEAIRLLEENPEGRTPNEEFILAQFYAEVGNSLRVSAVMTNLLRSERNQIPLYVRFYAEWLIREKRIPEAEEQVNLLERIERDSLATATLKARVAAAKKDLKKAWEALEPRTRDQNAPLGRIARICEDVGLYAEAERLLERFIQQNKQTNPAVVLTMATFYGRRQRTQEGLKICEEQGKELPWPQVGQAAVEVLAHARPIPPSDLTRVSEWLENAIQKAKKEERAILLHELAAIRNLQGNYDGSIQLYLDALAARPNDVLAMNNLAYLLSAWKKAQKAGLEQIEQAKRLRGEHPTLLDTEALIWINAGKPEKAVELLEKVVAAAPSGVGFFHLALAEQKLNHDFEARQAWRKAQERGISVADLHPLEEPEFEKLSGKYGASSQK